MEPANELFCLGFLNIFTCERKDTEKQTFDLGNGRVTYNIDEACQHFLKRDFSQFNFENGLQESALFVPPFFSLPRGDWPDTDTPEFEQVFKALKGGTAENIQAQLFEAEIFNVFKRFFNSNDFTSRNVTVLQGWNKHWSQLKIKASDTSKMGEEHDLLIIDGANQLVLLFEAKLSISNPNTLGKAKAQLANQATYFRDYHGHTLTPDWKIVTVIATKTNDYNCNDCKGNCSLLIMTPNSLSNVSSWWQNLLKIRPQVSRDHATGDNCYKNLVGRIVGLSSSCEMLFSTRPTGHQGKPKRGSNLCKERDGFNTTLVKARQAVKEGKTGDKEPISASMAPQAKQAKKKGQYPDQVDSTGDERILFFLTPDQKTVLSTKGSKRVVIQGVFGAGKSLLLKLKARELAMKNEPVLYLVGDEGDIESSSTGNHFYDLTVADFKPFDNVTVKKTEDLGKKEILGLYSEGKVHIFWDECLSIFKEELRKDFAALESTDDKDNFFWIAGTGTGSRDFVRMSPLRGFELITLRTCLRNKITILQFLKTFFTLHLDVQIHAPNKEDMPIVIIDNEKVPTSKVLNMALETYKHDCVLFVGYLNCIEHINNLEDWKIKSWEEYCAMGRDSEPNTLVVSQGIPFVTGIEAKNVIIFDESQPPNDFDTITEEELETKTSNYTEFLKASLSSEKEIPQASREFYENILTRLESGSSLNDVMESQEGPVEETEIGQEFYRAVAHLTVVVKDNKVLRDNIHKLEKVCIIKEV